MKLLAIGITICSICYSTTLFANTEIPAVKITAAKPAPSPHLQKLVITERQIKDSGANNISQLLNAYAGVETFDLIGDGSQLSVSLRGFGDNASSNSLILLDGQPLKNPDIAAPEIASIPLSEIKSIEIIPGSRGTEYDDQAVGGIVNIITQKPKPHALEVAVSAGSYNHHEFQTNASHIFENGVQFRLAGIKKHTNNYRQHNDLDQDVLSGQVAYPYATGLVKLRYQNVNTQQLFAGALSAQQVEQNRRQALNQNDYSRQTTDFMDVGWTQNLAHEWKLITAATRNQTNSNGLIGSHFSQTRTMSNVAPRLTGHIGSVQTTVGTDFEYDYYKILVAPFINMDSQKIQSLFTRFVAPVTKKLTALFGARAANLDSALSTQNNRVNINNQAVVTEVGLSYQFNPNIDFFVRRDGNFRFPKADENTDTPSGVIGLKTQTGVSYEAGTNIQQGPFTHSLMIYELRLRNEIAFDPDMTPSQPFGANRNLDPTKRDGFTLGTKYNISPKLAASVQYSYVDAHFSRGTNSGNRIPFVAQNLLRLSGNYHFLEAWNLYAEAIYSGNRYPSNDDQNQGGLIGGYTVYNFNIAYKIKSLIISARVNNIFDKRYNTFTVFNSFSSSNSFYPAPERNFMLTADYLFT